MALPFPVPNINLPNLPGEANDLLAKDLTMPLSELLAGAGWRGKSNNIARGVIKCESNGNPDAYNDTPCGNGENAVGLMQVCTIHRGTKGIPKDKAAAAKWLKDPVNNVSAGRKIYLSQGWGAWACPKVSTDWDPQINVRKLGADSLPGRLADAAVDPLLEPLEVIGGFFGIITQSATWWRIGKVWFGGMLLVMGAIGLLLAAAKTAGKTPAGKVAKAVVPAGKIVKAAT